MISCPYRSCDFQVHCRQATGLADLWAPLRAAGVEFQRGGRGMTKQEKCRLGESDALERVVPVSREKHRTRNGSNG
jgi:hypothetical protein